ncbi:hypothetical protein [Psychrobacillus lasiicapitis]|uniref:Uncharacterized protein n=1 Tax=Psychrobacillus lasiicapitis TaxID=1636719 RepID=A0A544T6X5_9BACI|nr:hypothetical protein [Psychrobacillus lasiicapitis]TQR13205.1 hypothetical protein FG382_11835 [Psychrobacillus lasiicapitis]GGA33583.1 hypothetical protein GCM10011384_24050 [Psychrobacillus lasiicapitis]
MIEVITVVNLVIEVTNSKDYQKEVEQVLRSNTSTIQHIETISISPISDNLKASALAKFRVLIEERKENKFLDDYVGLVLPKFYNFPHAMPLSNQIYKISRIEG